MDFRKKAFLTLTGKSGGILGPEMYVRPEGISAYGRVTEEASYYLVGADRDNWDVCAKDICHFVPQGSPVMEYGPGGEETVRKAKRVINALNSASYTGVDISQSSIDDAIGAIKSIKDDIEAIGVLKDFWDQEFPISEEATLAFFAGGSIENLDVPRMSTPPRKELTTTLETLGRRTHGGWLLISIDSLQEDIEPQAYIKAYSGPANAEFNLGVFHRMKEELKIDIDPNGFEYKPEFHKPSGAIMHMAYATKDQSFLFDGCLVEINRGDAFHLQNSFRFTEKLFIECANEASLTVLKVWKHPHASMQLYLLKDDALVAVPSVQRPSAVGQSSVSFR